jgi:signal transduction histidine kinase
MDIGVPSGGAMTEGMMSTDLGVLRQNENLELRVRELMEANDALARELAQSRRSERITSDQIDELQSFTQFVSQDLRAPLRAMQGFADILLEDCMAKLDPVMQDHARRISGAARHMDSLIVDLLSFKRLTFPDCDPQACSLDHAVETAIGKLEGEIRAKAAVIDSEMPLGYVRAHRELLTKAVLNLISNAVRFTAPGVRARVRIRSERRGYNLRLWVEDNGIGIGQEHHERIFRLAERLNEGGPYPGTGIGLAIVRKCMVNQGGRVGLESTQGGGSRFWLELPHVEGRS